MPSPRHTFKDVQAALFSTHKLSLHLGPEAMTEEGLWRLPPFVCGSWRKDEEGRIVRLNASARLHPWRVTNEETRANAAQTKKDHIIGFLFPSARIKISP